MLIEDLQPKLLTWNPHAIPRLGSISYGLCVSRKPAITQLQCLCMKWLRNARSIVHLHSRSPLTLTQYVYSRRESTTPTPKATRLLNAFKVHHLLITTRCSLPFPISQAHRFVSSLTTDLLTQITPEHPSVPHYRIRTYHSSTVIASRGGPQRRWQLCTYSQSPS